MSYKVRQNILLSIGFCDYTEYLASELWKKVRGRALRRDKGKCCCCDRSATEVHHRQYDRATLLGDNLEWLVSICRTCHEAIETENGFKLTMEEADLRLVEAMMKNPSSRRKRRVKSPCRGSGKCLACGNTAKWGKDYCRQHLHMGSAPSIPPKSEPRPSFPLLSVSAVVPITEQKEAEATARQTLAKSVGRAGKRSRIRMRQLLHEIKDHRHKGEE